MGKLKVVELFAGVGGFRLGLEGYEKKSASSGYEEVMPSNFEVVWSNQYEPLTPNKQHASLVYQSRWKEPKEKHSSEDIEKVIEKNFKSIPDHDLLVGGFPCQDYSVATTLKNSKGLVGKKGVLWWSIYNILQKKGKNKPDYLFLENVDRLLSSPVSQRGRDFAVMLSCLHEQGYAVEWRVINAADYGMPQRRRRVYVLGYKKGSPIYKKLASKKPKSLIEKSGIIGSAFPCSIVDSIFNFKISKNFDKESKSFNKKVRVSPFKNSGFMVNGRIFTVKTKTIYSGKPKTLSGVLETNNPPKNPTNLKEFYINEKERINMAPKKQIDGTEKRLDTVWDKWKYLKGSKSELKVNKNQGYSYKYGEGRMAFPDPLDKPSRTIITGEGGSGASRFKHVVKDGSKHRRLTPIELERLNMFPDNHTAHLEVTNAKRAFFMGNALVVGIVEKIGLTLNKTHNV